jgi:electron transport complex protein RnfB
MAQAGPRRRTPKTVAVIDGDNCTGCEACIEMCPVDCIHLHVIPPGIKGTHAWCEIDIDRCIGCKLCIRFPRRRGAPKNFELLVCPWEAIAMVPTTVASDGRMENGE